MTGDDQEAVLAIYAEGMATGHATFQNDLPTWREWDEGHIEEARLVAVKDGEILGWAALTPVSGRCVYAGVAEVSLYVAEKGRGQGIGKALMDALIEGSEVAGIWTLQAGIFPENKASVALHAYGGFRLVGRREALGKMAYGPLQGQWRDVLLMERRSSVAGRS